MVNLQTVRTQQLDDLALPILAHEIGHHVYVPGNLADNARMIAAIKPVLFGLPDDTAHVVANLYGDLLINDRLQRRAEVDIAAVYRKLNAAHAGQPTSRVWKVYTRIYEHLWRLAPGTLAPAGVTPEMNADAALSARLVRHHAGAWLAGARRFACILYPYLHEDAKDNVVQTFCQCGLCDTRCAGCNCQGGADTEAIPDGLTGIDPAELGADDDLDDILGDDEDDSYGRRRTRGNTTNRERKGDRVFREPLEYGALLRALGLNLSDHDIAMRYYRERALPHLVPFPARKMPQAKEPLAEGYETWEPSDNLEDLDVFGSVVNSPAIVPGVTTVKRVYGEAPGSDPAKQPVDLYLGIDCSGSMPNPQYTLSYPVLAGTIMALSALRVGARVMAVLSGEPGESLSTDGFVSDERKVLHVLTSYLGTGYTFGIHRLRDTFSERKESDREVHILIVTDHDIFALLDGRAGSWTGRGRKKKDVSPTGWACAHEAVAKARGGGTYVLNMTIDEGNKQVAQMRADGWKVHGVRSWEDMMEFARAFVRENYEGKTP
jgi:hypothetical protein